MMLPVLEPVDDRVAGRARTAQHACVITLREYAATASEPPIDRARDADRQSLHATRERLCVVGLDDEMDVIRLYREVDQSRRARRGRNGCAGSRSEGGAMGGSRAEGAARRGAHGS